MANLMFDIFTSMSSSISDALFTGRLRGNSRRKDIDDLPLFSTRPIYKLLELAHLPKLLLLM